MKKGLQSSHWTNDIKLENGKGKVCIQSKTHHGNDNRSITLQETCAINKALKLKKKIWQTCEGEIYNIITKELYNSLNVTKWRKKGDKKGNFTTDGDKQDRKCERDVSKVLI